MSSLRHLYKQLSNNILTKSLWFGCLTLMCLIPAILSILYAPLVPDTAYYLSIVERINDGIIPYRDLALGYTPLVFYIAFLLKKIFSIGINYEFYVTAHFVLQWICAYLVYVVSRLTIKSKKLSFYAAVLFLLASHWNDGNYFLLETPAVFFGLLAITLSLKYPTKIYLYFFIGILSSLSFLCKQYGLGFLGLLLYLSFFNTSRAKQFLMLITGFAIPIAVCYEVWGSDIFTNIFNGYGEKRTTLMGIWAIVGRATYLFTRVPILMGAMVLIPLQWRNWSTIEKRQIGLMTLGILGFLLQFYFAKYAHYYLFVIPFAAILAIQLLAFATTKYKKITGALISLSVLLSVYATYHDQVYKVYYLQKNTKRDQYELAQKIRSTVDTHKHLYIADIGLINQYYLTNMTPPNLKTIGYTFAIALTEKTHLQQINSAEYVLKYKTEYNHYNLNTAKVRTTLKVRSERMLNKDVVLFE